MSNVDFLLLGDSNVRRFLSSMGRQAEAIQFVQVRSLEELGSGLSSIRPTFTIILFGFITNLISTAAEGLVDATQRMNAIEDMLNTVIPMLM